MIINCECGKKKFNIDGSLIPKEGRLLKCGSCSKIWHYTPNIETKNDEELDVRINENVIKNKVQSNETINDEKTGLLALRASVIQGIKKGDGKISLINFFEAYPTKTVILNVNALSKVMNKVESISELLDFFTNSPLEKIKTN